VYTAETLIPEPSSSTVLIVTINLKRYINLQVFIKFQQDW